MNYFYNDNVILRCLRKCLETFRAYFTEKEILKICNKQIKQIRLGLKLYKIGYIQYNTVTHVD